MSVNIISLIIISKCVVYIKYSFGNLLLCTPLCFSHQSYSFRCIFMDMVILLQYVRVLVSTCTLFQCTVCHSLMSRPLRCRGEVDDFVGEGEAVLEESLPPASPPTYTELNWGTGGAFFRLRKFPSSTPLLRPSALHSKVPSSEECALRRGSLGLSVVLVGDSELLLSPASPLLSSSVPLQCPPCSLRTLARLRVWKSG